MRLRTLILFSLALSAAASCNRQDDQRQVGQSFERYMAAWERNDRKAVWDMMSERMRAGNDNNEAKFENDRETPDVRILAHTTKSIGVSGDRAAIEAEARMSADWGRQRGAELERFQFIRENGRWVFDDERPVNPS